MCLNKITRVIENPTQDEVVAWKVFRLLQSGKLIPEYRDTYELKTDTWLQSSRVLIVSDEPIDVDKDKPLFFGSTYKRYNSGFHCYTTYEDAVERAETVYKTHSCKHVVRQVRVRQVHTYGIQWSINPVPCLVAYEMYVPSEQPVQQESNAKGESR